MKGIPPWVTYTVLRLLAIAVPLLILLLVVPFEYWPISVIAAVIIGLCLSYLFLGAQRAAVSRDIYERRHSKRPTTVDDDAEDAEIDRQVPEDDETSEPGSERESRTEADAIQQPNDSGQL